MPAFPPLLGSTGSTTLVLAVALVVLGVVMIAAAIWLVRATRTDLPLLGPLEVMSERRFVKRDAAARAAALSAARPPGAPAPAPIIPIEDRDEGEDEDERPDGGAPAAVGVAPLHAQGPHEVNGHRHVEAQDELAAAQRDADLRADVEEAARSAPADAASPVGGDVGVRTVAGGQSSDRIDAEIDADEIDADEIDADEIEPDAIDAAVTDAAMTDEGGAIVEAEVVDAAPDPAAADDAIRDAEIIESPGHNGAGDRAQVEAAQRAR